MEEKLNITDAVINGEVQPSVNARELWKALQSKQEFANWIKNRIADFEEGIDFTVDKIVNGENKGRFPSTEYTLTLDTAKHLCMLERNEVGKKIRQYFIEVEKEYWKNLEKDSPCCPASANQQMDVYQSTCALIDKINRALCINAEVNPEVLRYAGNVARLIGKVIHKPFADDFTEFVQSIAPGRYCRSDIYNMYCSRFSHPMNARWFWPRVRALRPCQETRSACNRYVVFE